MSKQAERKRKRKTIARTLFLFDLDRLFVWKKVNAVYKIKNTVPIITKNQLYSASLHTEQREGSGSIKNPLIKDKHDKKTKKRENNTANDDLMV